VLARPSDEFGRARPAHASGSGAGAVTAQRTCAGRRCGSLAVDAPTTEVACNR
jgi:hypothetical protein